MFSFGKKNGTRAMVAIMLSFIPLIAVLMVFPQLGDQVPMKVSSAGEVLRWGSKWELMLIPAFGFLLSGATIATGIKNAKGYRDDKASPSSPSSVRSATRRSRESSSSSPRALSCTASIPARGLASNPIAWRALSSIVDAKTLQAA